MPVAYADVCLGSSELWHLGQRVLADSSLVESRVATIVLVGRHPVSFPPIGNCLRIPADRPPLISSPDERLLSI